MIGSSRTRGMPRRRSSLPRAAGNAPVTRSSLKGTNPATDTVPLNYSEIRVPGKSVPWRHGKKTTKAYQWPTVVRISRIKKRGEYYKSVHAAKTTPAGTMVGIYLGAVIECSDPRDGRWRTAIPGYRKMYSLDSKITEDWPWEKYLAKRAVGGFFNSSRKSRTRNLRGANCRLEWFRETIDDVHGENVFAALFTKRSVRRGAEFLWDYPWL